MIKDIIILAAAVAFLIAWERILAHGLKTEQGAANPLLIIDPENAPQPKESTDADPQENL